MESGEGAVRKSASDKNAVSTKFFGRAISQVTEKSCDIPWQEVPTHAGGNDVNAGEFPTWLRAVIEPHIAKCRKARTEALSSAHKHVTALPYWGSGWQDDVFEERDFNFNTSVYGIREAFCEAAGCDAGMLSAVHTEPGLKDDMMARLCMRESNVGFQNAFDELMRGAVAPLIGTIYTCDEIVYQAFPCVRIVRPGDFSIGPHADCAYGHSPFSVNIYVPLTPIYGSNALYLESYPGREDWHPIQGEYGYAKLFRGGVCAHWTTENNTPHTRVSLDFRVIPRGRWLQDGWSVRDTFALNDGYYSVCVREDSGFWRRVGNLLCPDERCGHPFTRKK